DFGARMGDYYESFVTDEARALQFTLDDLRAWKPAATAARRGRKKDLPHEAIASNGPDDRHAPVRMARHRWHWHAE
ncbi:MAG: hypothetical protein KDI53_18795, partial [Candidatus Accumulibacter sp.]|nr:hypothetical protein [Accumulibacter sp.]